MPPSKSVEGYVCGELNLLEIKILVLQQFEAQKTLLIYVQVEVKQLTI